jgi:hypothetical protein
MSSMSRRPHPKPKAKFVLGGQTRRPSGYRGTGSGTAANTYGNPDTGKRAREGHGYPGTGKRNHAVGSGLQAIGVSFLLIGISAIFD